MPVCARQGHRHYSEAPALLGKVPIEGSESLSSAGSGTTDDRLLVQCNACASRDTKRTRTGVFTGVDMSRKVRDSRTKPSTVQVVVFTFILIDYVKNTLLISLS